jgi:hypothetical protein
MEVDHREVVLLEVDRLAAGVEEMAARSPQRRPRTLGIVGS